MLIFELRRAEMDKKQMMAFIIISMAAISSWGCKSPTDPDNKPRAAPKTLSVTIYSDPWHANIWINGYDTGYRTHMYVYLEYGTHEVMLLKPAYQVWKMKFNLTEEHVPHGRVINAQLEGIHIKVEDPASNTIWIKGQEALITWDPEYIPPVEESDDNGRVTVEHGTPYLPRVKIYLFKGGTEVMTIVHDLENTGSYSWTVDPSLEDGNDYQVRVLSSWETPRIAEIYGKSEPFTIQ